MSASTLARPLPPLTVRLLPLLSWCVFCVLLLLLLLCQAYRCMVEHGDLESPSFLLESVVNGDQQGRYSFVGAMPALEVVAKGHEVGVCRCGCVWGGVLRGAVWVWVCRLASKASKGGKGGGAQGACVSV